MFRPRLLLTLIAALGGCAREPSFRDVQKGRLALDAGERGSIEAMLDQADISPRKLKLEGDGHDVVTIEDGRVVELRFDWELRDPAPLAGLPALRRLRLGAAKFADLSRFGSHPVLTELGLGGYRSRVESLAGLEGCGALRQVSVRGPLPSLAPLAACPGLESLYLDGPKIDSFASLPPLPALQLLSIGPVTLASLAGLERAPHLEELILSDARPLTDLAGFPLLAELRRLKIYRGTLETLRGLPPLPALEELIVEDTSLASLDGLPGGEAGQQVALGRLRRLEAPSNELQGTLTLPRLPVLETLDLRANSLVDLSLPPLPALETIDLTGNAVADLDGLGTQAGLTSLLLTGNPVEDLTALLPLPSLRDVAIVDTEVTAVPKELYERGVTVRMNEAQIEANAWEKALREAWHDEGFVERLPGGDGKMTHHRGRCEWEAGTFRKARLSCRKTAASLTGLMGVGLVQVDPLAPTAGGTNRIRVRVTLSVEEGLVRIYVRDRIDFKGLAEALAGHTDTSKPWISFGDQRDPEDYRDGYRFAEARPGHPATVSGEAAIMFDQVFIWLESVRGTSKGISYTVEPP